MLCGDLQDETKHGVLIDENVYSAERRSYLQEIDALRTKAARTDELEAENSRLATELEEARQRQREAPKVDGDGGNSKVTPSSATSKANAETATLTVDIDEYNRVKENLIKLENDYGKLLWARNFLDTRVREQKETLRQWKEYRKNWILKHPNKRVSHLQPSSARATSLATADQHRSSSAPTPPALPEVLTPSPSGVSRSPSPHHHAAADLKDNEYLHNPIREHHSKDQGLQSHEVSVSQAGRDGTTASNPSDVTQATPESEAKAESIKTEPATGGSSPIIVYERSLKRRHSARGRVPNVHVHEDDQRRSGAASTIHPPKDEQISSPIQAPPLIRLDGPHDSLDLDDVGGHLDTPRKRQRMAQERLRSSLMAYSAAQGVEDMPDDMTADEALQTLYEEHFGRETERDREAISTTENQGNIPSKTALDGKKARRDERMARQHAHNDRVYQRLEAAEKEDPNFDRPMSSSPTTNESATHIHIPKDPRDTRQLKPHLASPVVLKPKDVNAFVLPRTSDLSASRKRPCPPSCKDRGAAFVPALAEDGEGLPSDGEALKAGKTPKNDRDDLLGPLNKKFKAPPTHDRLGALLTKPSPEKSLLIAEEATATAIPDDHARSKTPTLRSACPNGSKGPATPRSLPAKKAESKHRPSSIPGLAGFEPIDATMDRYSKSAQAVSKITKAVPTLRNSPLAEDPETRPEQEPLRARPVHRLGLQDFRLNPAHSEYAYNETVRKHEEKKTLSGCTDRHCQRCQGLRQYVTESGYKTAQKPGESEGEADLRLMRTFLGDNHRRLKTMSADERADLLIDAKVREFANRYGCHREAFSKSREPPGFWELDFPSTQEEKENRIKADVMEREKVGERYWEATRLGGKWKFADE